MTSVNALRFSPTRTFLLAVLAGLLTIGLVASTATLTLAQGSGTWTTTGSLNTARTAHTATLLQNG